MKMLHQRAEIYGLLPTEAIGMEVGVWKGENARTLLNQARPSVLHLVDPWPLQMLWNGKPSGDNGDAMYAAVCSAFQRRRGPGQVVIHRTNLQDLVQWWPAATLDWLYLDADHTHTGELLPLAASLLRPDGYLAGHDYVARPDRQWDIVKAVDAFVSEGRADWIALTEEPFPSYLLRLR